jgi:hypothetical protein
MARTNRLLWILLLVALPASADGSRTDAKSINSTKEDTTRSAHEPHILADEHGTLVLSDERGTKVSADEHGTLASADERRAEVLADEHGTLVLTQQQVLADEHGTLMIDVPSASRSAEPE